MASSTRSKDKTETVSQCHVVSDQHCSTCGSVSQRDIDEITRKVREVTLSNITKNGKELNELPPKVSADTERLKRTEKEGEELQINSERGRDGERRGKQKRKKVKAEHDKPEASCKPKEEHSDGNLKELAAKKEQPTRQKVMELEGTLDNWEQTIERYKKFIATSSITLGFIDDRSVSSCIDDIRKANNSLKEEMERKFAHLESPASTKVNKEQEAKTAQDVKKVEINDPTMCNIGSATTLEGGKYPITKTVQDVKKVTITNPNQCTISFDTTAEGRKYPITSITELSDGKMVISGAAPDRKSHIIVINSKGEIQDKYQMPGRSDVKDTPRYCCNFSEKKVLTVYGKQEVAIYDVSHGKQCTSDSSPCTPSNISKSTKPQGWKMTCVAYNPKKQEVIVCYGHAAALSIYTDQLECQFTEPFNHTDIVKVNDIAVHPCFLLVCHSNGANTFTIKEHEIITGFKLDKPKEASSAISVCVDKNSFIYMLWSGGKNETTLAQYSKDGLELLLEKPLGKVKNGCLTTLDVDGTERLVIASNDPGILHSYQLIAEE